MTISLQDIRAAAEQIGDSIVKTPCVPSRRLSELTGADVRLKLENLQTTGSFKVRGALVKLLSLSSAKRQRGVVAMSAGNHAQAVAFHAQRLGIRAVIVMPRFTPNVKQEQTRRLGAEVILHGDNLAESGALAHRLEKERGLAFVHPYDDPLIIAGQGTIGLEIIEAEPDLDDLIVPIGGGGLIAGIATAAKAMRPSLRVTGVETARYPSMRCALDGEEPRYGRFTVAEGIAIKAPGELTLPIVAERVDHIHLVDEPLIERAVLMLLEVEKTVAEGAGAVGLAALLDDPDRFAGRKVGIVISGGNIDLPVLSSIIQRGLVHSGRLVRLRVEALRDVPGELAKVARCIGDTGCNIVQVNHQRTFAELPLQSAEVQFVLQTRGSEHVQEIIASLKEHGYGAVVDDDA